MSKKDKKKNEHLKEAERIQQELDKIKDDARFALNGIVKTVLRRRIQQELDRAKEAERCNNE